MNDMGRKAKMRLDYFPMDVDIFQDLKIRKLIKRQGGKAITVYTLLLCYIYKNGYYMKWDSDLPFICSEQTGFEEAYVREVINVCLQLGLFSKSLYDKDGILTSRGIQERYQRICQLTRRTSTVSEYSLIDDDDAEDIPQEPTTTKRENVPTPQPPFQAIASPVPTEKPTRKTRKSTKKEEPAAPVKQPAASSPSSTLDEYINELDKDDIWLEQIQFLHGMNKDSLRNELKKFQSECIANGKTQHESVNDVKQHFNSWLRIIINKKNNESIKPANDKRKGHLLSSDGEKEKDYGGTF